MNAEEKESYYRSEYFGAPTVDHMNFRCQKTLATWIRTQAMMENRDASMVIRRLLVWAATQEGFSRDAI